MRKFNAAKFIGSSLVAVLAGGAAPAMAQCSGTPLNFGQLQTIFGGGNKLVCGRPGAGYPGAAADRWQEEHLGGAINGDLFDYKLGANHAIDPRKKVGVWFISRDQQNPRLVHDYSIGGGVQYQWAVFGPTDNTAGSVYSFCTGVGGAEHVRAFVRINGGTGCGNSYP